MSAFATILDALADAVEAITPSEAAAVPWRRWRGPGLLGEANFKPSPRARAFQFQPGAVLFPRSMSSSTDATAWRRTELILVAGYDLKTPRPGDANGLGPILEIEADESDLWKALADGDALASAGATYLRLLPLEPFCGPVSAEGIRRFRFDLEYTRA